MTQIDLLAMPHPTTLPAPLAPAEGAPVPATGLVLRWVPAPGTATTRLELAREAAFAAPILALDAPGDALDLSDVLPDAAGAFFWRVGEGAQWSAPASFTTVGTAPGRTATTEEGSDLRPLEPAEGAPADADALTFQWASSAAHERHALQIARDVGFADLVAELDAPGNHLTLHRLLPADDRAYHWRVGDGRTWSAPAHFLASTDTTVQAFVQARKAEQQQAALAALREQIARAAEMAEANAPWRTGTTSGRQVVTLLYTMFVTFALTAFMVFLVAP